MVIKVDGGNRKGYRHDFFILHFLDCIFYWLNRSLLLDLFRNHKKTKNNYVVPDSDPGSFQIKSINVLYKIKTL